MARPKRFELLTPASGEKSATGWKAVVQTIDCTVPRAGRPEGSYLQLPTIVISRQTCNLQCNLCRDPAPFAQDDARADNLTTEIRYRVAAWDAIEPPGRVSLLREHN
jgi:hypothetical protein